MKKRSHLGQASRLEGGRSSQQPVAVWQKTMRRGHRVLLVVLYPLFFAVCLSAQSQSYSVDWYKISGGGGTSTNSKYSVTGTIGQTDAGAAMTGGGYSVTGGFWSLIAAVPNPGAPTLNVTQSGNSVIVSWLYPSSGFTLQQNDNLSTTNWTASGFMVVTDGLTNSISITPPTGNLFFRLAK